MEIHFYDNDNDGYIDLTSDGNAYRVGFEVASAFDPSSIDLSLNGMAKFHLLTDLRFFCDYF